MLSVSFHPFLWRNRLYPLTIPAGKRLQVGAMTSLIPPTSCGQTGPSLGDGGALPPAPGRPPRPRGAPGTAAQQAGPAETPTASAGTRIPPPRALPAGCRQPTEGTP